MANADTVGSGVPRRKPSKIVKLKVHPDVTPLSEMGDWSDVPDVANQIQEPDAYRLGKQEVMVFDLSKPEDLTKYNELLTNSASAKANIAILEEDRKFGEKSESFKVYVKVQHVQFKKLFKKGLKPDTVEAQEAQLNNL